MGFAIVITLHYRHCGVRFRETAESIMSIMSRLLACMLIAWHVAAVGAEVIRIPKPEFRGDRRNDYALQLLRSPLNSGFGMRMSSAPTAATCHAIRDRKSVV